MILDIPESMPILTQYSIVESIVSPGTEHRNRERRTPHLSAPRLPFSPATGSMLQDAPQTTPPARDRMLVTAFRSPATAALFGAPISRSTFLACYFASYSLFPLPVRPFCSATLAGWPRQGQHQCFWPVAVSTTRMKTATPASTSLWDYCLPPDQSVQLDSQFSARLPNPPDLPSLPAAGFYL
jgi:hypothetical protein